MIAASVAITVTSAGLSGATSVGAKSTKVQLVEREGARGIVVLVPKSWTLSIDDGGGSGATSTWTNPKHKRQRVVAFTGSAVGWYEADGVTGSVDPSFALPPDAEVSRRSVSEFRYSVPTKNRHLLTRGVWIGELDEGVALGYRQVTVTARKDLKKEVNRILRAFTEAPMIAAATTTTQIATQVPSAPKAGEVTVWISVLGSLPQASISEDGAWGRADELSPFTPEYPGVLSSGYFSGLNPGYWVVYLGPYAYREDAEFRCASLSNLGISDCYPRAVFVPANADVGELFRSVYD